MKNYNHKTVIIFLILIFSLNSFGRDRSSVPEWITNGIIYQIWPRSFTVEGTLKSAAIKLPDIKELGATIVYVCPVMLQDSGINKEFWSPRQKASPANNPRNPYRIMDYTKVDPEYGTEEDLKNFINTAHNLGLKVLMDLVYLHTGPNNVLTQKPEYHKRDSDGKFIKNNWGFYNLNFENKDLRMFLLKNMEDWVIKYGFDGWRCDVSGGVPLDFWEEARTRLEKIRPDIGMLAESMKPDELKKAFDMSYGFSWYNVLVNVFEKGKPATELTKTWNKMNKDFPNGTLFIRYSDNHDLYRPNLVFGQKGSSAVSVLNFMIDGVPFLFNGQEIGDASPYGIHYYPKKSYNDNGAINWNAQQIPYRKELRNWYKKLIALRKSEPTLLNGKTLWLNSNNPESVVAFLRADNHDTILTIINVSNRKIDVNLETTEKAGKIYEALFTDSNLKNVEVIGGKASVSLDSFGYFVGKLKKE